MNQLKPTIFISQKIPQIALELLRDANFNLNIHPNNTPPTAAELLNYTKDAVAMITMLSDQIDETFLNQNKHLKIISNYAVGYNNIDLNTAKKLGIIVTNTPDVLTDATAELSLALLLACSRRIQYGRSLIENNLWKSWTPTAHLGIDLNKKTLGIIGAGRIGQSFADKCRKLFNMNILYYSPTEKKQFEQTHQATKVDLEELFIKSDVVSIHCPLNSKTNKLIGIKELSKLKSSAILINTARGEICDEQALIQVLENKKIFAAGLDVFCNEPISAQHPFVKLDNVVITPHLGSATFHTREQMGLLCAQNIILALSGRPTLTPL